MNLKKSQMVNSVDNILVSSLLDLVPRLLWQRLGLHLSCPPTPGGSQVLEHALAVGAQHPLQAARHRVGPEEVVVQGGVRVDPLAGVQGEELVYQVTCVGILDIVNILSVLSFSCYNDQPSHRV